MITNDLSAVHKNLADVPANLSNDPEAKRIRAELAQREAARDAAMQRARACDSTATYRCARKYAKEAIAIDSSYADSRVLLKRVTYKAAQAKKAADAAALQAALNASRAAAVHVAPIREAVAVPRVVTASAVTSPAPVTNPAPVAAPALPPASSTPHLFAAPPARAPREQRVIREARETRPIQETREVASVPQAQTTNVDASESRGYGDGPPFRAFGRGEAH